MSADKCYWVESERGGYAAVYTFKEACELAESDSIENSCIMMVRRDLEYVPERIYFCGHIYEPVGSEAK